MTRKTRNGMTFEGERGRSGQCPVARWLLEEPTFNETIVGVGGASVLTTDGEIFAVRSQAVADFVRWFDGD